MRTEDMYYNEQKRSEVMEAARRLRRKFLRYQQAEMFFTKSVRMENLTARIPETTHGFIL